MGASVGHKWSVYSPEGLFSSGVIETDLSAPPVGEIFASYYLRDSILVVGLSLGYDGVYKRLDHYSFDLINIPLVLSLDGLIRFTIAEQRLFISLGVGTGVSIIGEFLDVEASNVHEESWGVGHLLQGRVAFGLRLGERWRLALNFKPVIRTSLNSYPLLFSVEYYL